MQNNENALVYLSDMADALASVSDDTTCPLHIAAQIDQIVGLAEPVKAVVIPPVNIGDTAYFIIKGQIYIAKICYLHWSQNRHGVTSEIRGEVYQYHTVAASFDEWGKTVYSSYQEATDALAKQKERG